jgi:hypothetical protein
LRGKRTCAWCAKMANRLLTLREASDLLWEDFTRIMDAEGIPEDKRVEIVIAALSPLMRSSSPPIVREELDWTDGAGRPHRYKCGLNPDPAAIKHMVNFCTCAREDERGPTQ